MSVVELLLKLNKLNISLEADNGRLRINGPEEALSAALINEIKSNKERIIKHFDYYVTIKEVEKKDYYPLSPAQKRMFFLQQFNEESVAYNIPNFIEIKEKLDRDRLMAAFRGLIVRHGSYRTSFRVIESEPIQRINGNVDFDMAYYRAGKREKGPGEKSVEEIIAGFVLPFDLGKAPLLRAGIIEANDKSILLIDMHHIIADGVSHRLIEEEFISLYQGKDQPVLRLQYKDYVLWQNSKEQKDLIKNQEDYWLSILSAELPVSNLPMDFERPVIQSFAGSSIDFELDAPTARGLNEIAARYDATLYMVVLSLFTILLSRLSSREDIIVGSPTAGRRHSDLKGIIGMFVNTLTLRNYPKWDQPYEEFLRRLKDRTLEAFENQDYQFEDLVDKLSVPRDTDRNPVFDVMFVLQNQSGVRAGGSGHTGEITGASPGVSKFDLTLTCHEMAGYMQCKFTYCTKLFKRETIERFIVYFKRIISNVLAGPGIKIADIEIVPQEEKQRLLFDFNNTAAAYPQDRTIAGLFEQQAGRTPGSAALVFEDKTLTYGAVNERTDRLVRCLREHGVKENVIVGIMVERSLELITGIMAVLKAGGVYLPIDTEYPLERIRYMCADSNVELSLTQRCFVEKYKNLSTLLDLEDPAVYGEARVGAAQAGQGGIESAPKNGNFAPGRVRAHNPAYIIYTSGSTGRPKGVLVSHRAVVNYVWWAARQYIKEKNVVFPLYTSISFDLTVTSLYTPLITGNRLIIYGQGGEGLLIEKVLKENRVDILKCTPAHLKVIREMGINADVIRFIVGGENLDVELARDMHRVFKGNPEIFNEYGPTEAAVGCMIYRFDPLKDKRKSVPIGVPAANTRIYVMDRKRNQPPVGTEGEIYIAGAGLADGYLNNAGLTAEKFPAAQERFYKSGDLACLLPDGNIEFLGRMDYQVKIRGYRIDLGEIENRLVTHESVREALVLAKGGQDGGTYLCAYIVAAGREKGGSPEAPGEEKSIDISGLRDYLSGSLPGYMIPAYFVRIDRIPLTANGKVDRKLLPEPGNLPGEEYTAPRSHIEEKLAEIWQTVLGVKKIGIRDNFFILGGDSIKTIQIAARLRKYGYKVEIRDIFRNPTIIGLSPLVKKVERVPLQSPVEGEVKLTPIQEWFFEKKKIDNHHFNQSVMLHSPEGFGRDAVNAVFAKLREHHDVLRMRYETGNSGKIKQVNGGLDEISAIVEYDLRGQENPAALLEKKANEIQSGINISQGPLMKIGLFHLKDGDRLLIVIHHLIIDGVSWRILFEDIDTLYHQYNRGEPLELPLKTDSYKYWAEKLAEYADSELFLKEKDYWAGLEAVKVPRIEKDFAGEDNFIKDTEARSFSLSEAETRSLLTNVNNAFGTEINDILLTGLALGFKDFFAHDRVLIALEGHGREAILKDVDINRTVGWYSSIYPVILNAVDEHDLSRRIKEVKEVLHRVPNKGIGYGILKYVTSDKHKKGLDFTLNPQVSFNYLGQFDADVKQMSFRVAGESTGNNQSERGQRVYEFDIIGIAAYDHLTISLSYNKNHYKAGTVDQLLKRCETRLKQVISHCLRIKERELTPSDLTYKSLSIDTLDRLTGQYPVQDIYPLSPLQQGMLFLTELEKSPVFYNRISYRFSGELDVSLIEKSIAQLIKRYDILRTLFIYRDIEDIDKTLQLVLKERQFSLFFEDIGENITGAEKEVRLKSLKEKDKYRRFDLSKDFLIRAAVTKLAKSEYDFTWSFHHIIMDGWCIGILVSEFFEIYSSYLRGREYRLPPVTQYRTYIEWLEKVNISEAKKYWRKYLAGYNETSAVPKAEKSINSAETFANERYSIAFEEEKTANLKKLANNNQVTMNILLQVIWGIILGSYTGKNDVVFGIVVSGRPADLKGIETMVGLFINTIPVRIKFDEDTTFSQLLYNTQKNAINSEPYHFCPLYEIQAESVLKQNLLDHVFAFENYPVEFRLEKAGDTDGEDNKKVPFKLEMVERYEQDSYGLAVTAASTGLLSVTFSFNANVYNRTFIEKTAGHIKEVTDLIVKNNDIKLKDIKIADDLTAIKSDVYNRMQPGFNF